MLKGLANALRIVIRKNIHNAAVHDIVGHAWNEGGGGHSGGIGEKRFVCTMCGIEKVIFWVGGETYQEAIKRMKKFYASWEEADKSRK